MDSRNRLKRVLITGASKGIGRAIAERLVLEGYEVTGTSRDPVKIPEQNRIPGVEYLPLDLTDKNSINTLIETLGDVDILINNAGIGQIGAVEEIPIERLYYLFEANLFGAVRIIQGFLPPMREKCRGFIINISSLAGRIPVPFSSVYAATKSALEDISLGLRGELIGLGIRVVVVAPMYIRTNLKQEDTSKENSPYYEGLMRVKRIRDYKMSHGTEPAVVAEKILKILGKRNPRFYYAVGRNASQLAFLSKHLSAGFEEKMIRRQFRLGK